MGCKPSPIGAIVRMYTFERRSVYIDPHYLPVMYGRYVDDAGTVIGDEENAKQLFDRIAEEDPDNRLSWEIDFPQSEETFTPFLGTQIRVDGEGQLHYKYYRKPQKKAITLHSRSHHPYRMKVETAKNFYRTAEKSCYSPEFVEESYTMIDELLKCNGYNNPRALMEYHPRRSTQDSLSRDSNPVWLKLPYIS